MVIGLEKIKSENFTLTVEKFQLLGKVLIFLTLKKANTNSIRNLPMI